MKKTPLYITALVINFFILFVILFTWIRIAEFIGDCVFNITAEDSLLLIQGNYIRLLVIIISSIILLWIIQSYLSVFQDNTTEIPLRRLNTFTYMILLTYILISIPLFFHASYDISYCTGSGGSSNCWGYNYPAWNDIIFIVVLWIQQLITIFYMMKRKQKDGKWPS